MHRLIIVAAIGTLIAIPFSMGQPATPSSQSSDVSFRVSIQMFDENGSAPRRVAEHRIIFSDGQIFAVPSEPEAQITIVDRVQDRIVLLDRRTKVRTVLPTNELMQLTAKLRASAKTPEQLEKLGIDAEIQLDNDAGTYAVAYGIVAYTTTTIQPKDPEAAILFGQFSAWASRLNIARAVGLPPLGRMKMNDQIARDGRLPKTTQLTISSANESSRYRSEHNLSESLTADDQKIMNEIRGMIALYRNVSLHEFPPH